MVTIHLPDAIYERLPKLYLLLALVLAIAPLASAKWLVVTVLLLAAAVISRRRRAYREDQRIQRTLALMEKHQAPRKGAASSESRSPSVVVL